MKDLKERIIEALKKDFHQLYVKEFTIGWKGQRFIRDIELGIMGLNNTEDFISDLVEEVRKEEGKRFWIAFNKANELTSEYQMETSNSFTIDDYKEVLEEKLDNLLKER